ncbi:MAG TPA: hypothetical protein VIQ31_21525 [Phormidium sp.]
MVVIRYPDELRIITASHLVAKAEAVPSPSYTTPISNAQATLIDANPKVNAQINQAMQLPKLSN